MPSKIEELQHLLDTDQFHHATYRNQGTLWEGLWIYKKDGSSHGFRGFSLEMSFLKSDPELMAQAEKLCAGTGISLGSYGQG